MTPLLLVLSLLLSLLLLCLLLLLLLLAVLLVLWLLLLLPSSSSLLLLRQCCWLRLNRCGLCPRLVDAVPTQMGGARGLQRGSAPPPHAYCSRGAVFKRGETQPTCTSGRRVALASLWSAACGCLVRAWIDGGARFFVTVTLTRL